MNLQIIGVGSFNTRHEYFTLHQRFMILTIWMFYFDPIIGFFFIDFMIFIFTHTIGKSLFLSLSHILSRTLVAVM